MTDESIDVEVQGTGSSSRAGVDTPRQSFAGRQLGAEPQAGAWAHRYPLLAILVMALIAYSDSFTGAFVFDDIKQVRDNVPLRDLGALLSWQGYAPFHHRYVGYLTFALNYASGKLEVVDYHVVNFCIHAVNAGLVYALVLLAFRTPRLRESELAGSAQAIAFFAAALFATHPLQTQAVTYIVQRFTSLAALFYLLAVVLFLVWRLRREAEDGGRMSRAALYAALLLCAILGMKTKQIAFTVPLAVILCELSFFEALQWRRRLFLLPIAATMLVVPLDLWSGLGGASSASALAEVTRVQTSVSRLDYLLTEASVILTYLRFLVWPTGQNLDHDFPVAHGLEPRVLGSGVALTAILALAWLLYRWTAPGGRRAVDPAARLVAFGVAWFFLALAVESSFVPIVDVINEHRVYLPSVGMFLGAGVAAAFLFRRIHAPGAARMVVLTAAILSAVLGVATFRRNRVWASEITIWTDAAQKSPGKSRPHANVGSALAMAGRLEEGVRELRRALEIEPDSSYARAQLGAALVALGRPGEAEPELRQALAARPRDPEALFNLAMALLRTGRREEAKPLFERFLEVAPPSYTAARRVAERAQR